MAAAVGKAAESMALGAHEALGGAIERTLLITRDAPTAAQFVAARSRGPARGSPGTR